MTLSRHILNIMVEKNSLGLAGCIFPDLSLCLAPDKDITHMLIHRGMESSTIMSCWYIFEITGPENRNFSPKNEFKFSSGVTCQLAQFSSSCKNWVELQELGSLN